jgi:hypothetical protein
MKVVIVWSAVLALLVGRLPAAQLLSEGFETYQPDALDANYPAGSNNSPDGGPGNPWWGLTPPDLYVVGAESGVTPHGGTQMVRGDLGFGFDQDFFNLAYRVNGSNPYLGELTFDWWFYDPTGPANAVEYQDYIDLAYYQGVPNNTDFTVDATSPPNADIGAPTAQLGLGASTAQSGSFDSTKYQALFLGVTNIPGMTNTSYDGTGWFNTSVLRSIGWHHAEIVVTSNGIPSASFYISGTNGILPTNAVLTATLVATNGFNVIEMKAHFGSLNGYYDDLSFSSGTNSVVVGPPGSIAISTSGNDAVLTWTNGWILQRATILANAGFVDVPGAVSPYTNLVTGPLQYFRLRK